VLGLQPFVDATLLAAALAEGGSEGVAGKEGGGCVCLLGAW
jgi:hypothetical protein